MVSSKKLHWAIASSLSSTFSMRFETTKYRRICDLVSINYINFGGSRVESAGFVYSCAVMPAQPLELVLSHLCRDDGPEPPVKVKGTAPLCLFLAYKQFKKFIDTVRNIHLKTFYTLLPGKSLKKFLRSTLWAFHRKILNDSSAFFLEPRQILFFPLKTCRLCSPVNLACFFFVVFSSVQMYSSMVARIEITV